MNLQPEHHLKKGEYTIESVLGQGGFGITYLGIQTNLNRKVAIKEFFMKEYCERDESTSHITTGSSGSREVVDRFRKKFKKEAETIAGLKNPHIIRIHDIFEENDTVYYVMEYIGGGSLKDKVLREGALSEANALPYIRQIAGALAYIHEQKILHLDVKPTNVLLEDQKTAVLIDFGIAKRYDETGGQTSNTPTGTSKGYAPLEQYKEGGINSFAPCTDIYSLGATLYFLLTGQQPPEASDLYDEGLPALPSSISTTTAKAIECAMQPRRKDRPQSIKEFLALLDEKVEEDEETKVVVIPTKSQSIKSEECKEPEKLQPEIPRKDVKPSTWKKYLGGIVGLLVIGLAIWSLTKERNPVIQQPEIINGISITQAVDLGLSVKWAGWNIGASAPEEYGGLYGWADPTGTKTSTNYDDYPSSNPPKNICSTQYDIARTKWGERWRLPSLAEIKELKDKCEWKWTTYKRIEGYKVTGPSGKSIFLPAAGYRDGTEVHLRGTNGDYWSGSLRESYSLSAYCLYFSSGKVDWYYSTRCYGRSVRPVTE